jgi:hypothetical protein
MKTDWIVFWTMPRKRSPEQIPDRVGGRAANELADHPVRKVSPATNRCHQRYYLPVAAAMHAVGAT